MADSTDTLKDGSFGSGCTNEVLLVYWGRWAVPG
jgi:hypothetical protein